MKDVIYVITVLILIVCCVCVYIYGKCRANRIAYTDRITQGANQAYLRRWVEQTMEKEKVQLCIVYMNLSKFKAINDFWGYKKGDELLKCIYDCIREELKALECGSRISADNYVICMRYESEKILKERLCRIAEMINKRFNENLDKYCHLTFRAGAYIIPDATVPYSVMVDRANIAARSLSTPSNNMIELAFYKEKDRTDFMRAKEIEDEMEAALANGEFEVYLQPKLDLSQNEMKGAEALVRWNSPEKGLLAPAKFIDLFEKNGFVKKIDLYVFETVCRYMRKWSDEGTPLFPISVNLSRLHFLDKNFLEQFEEIRKKYDIPAKYLEFELTERTVFEETELLMNAMRTMRERGYSCSLDDFGSGYSSLNILKELPIDVIKLDRGFFIGQYNEQSRVIIRAVINMAKDLNMKIVAEGVDTPEQYTFLKENGCNMMQAFLYEQPMPIPQFEERYQEG